MISTFFGQLAFTTPMALLALAALPALYFLLRVTPPAPRVIRFPATRLLEGLIPAKTTPSHTPWWILLIRLLAAGLLLLALSGPVLNPANPLSGRGPLRLVIENGWSAAPNWDAIINEADTIITQARREERQIVVVPTIVAPEAETPQVPLSASQALATLKGLKPYPWASDLSTLELEAFDGPSIFLSDGVHKDGMDRLIETLEQDGAVFLITPDHDRLPVLLKASTNSDQALSVYLNMPSQPDFPHAVQVMDAQGQVLDQQEATQSGDIVFDLPPELARQAAGFKVAGQNSAGARYLLDESGGPKTVGIATPEERIETEALREDGYFLVKAIEPFATLTTGSVAKILEAQAQAIILPDIGTMPTETLNALDEWVRAGGVLIRFAGPNMTRRAGEMALVPVRLRQDARALSGNLSWDEPQTLKAFPPQSPLYGLAISDPITVNRQILPVPDEALAEKTWAELEDGTPLITAAPHEAGLLIMVHTSAAANWSDLPLAGIYPEMLKRFIALAGRSFGSHEISYSALQPIQTLSGFGQLESPPDTARAIDAAEFDSAIPGPDHPPGLYGHQGVSQAFNLGDHVETVFALSLTPDRIYGLEQERALFPFLLIAAFALFVFDALIMLMIQNGMALRRAMGLLLLGIVLFSSSHAQAQAQPSYADGLYLAYIKSGDAALDQQTQAGLEVLQQILEARTSAEPLGVAGVNPENDELAFFPLLYWAIGPGQKPPSSHALERLQYYIDHGGTIMIDTRDGAAGTNAELLREMLAGLNIQPLMPLPEDHVLGKTFYLLDQFPGRYTSGQIWIETDSAGRDGVSSVILGSNDWAASWSEINLNRFGNRVFASGASREQELSLRTGINIVLYALTGNYKSDQVHVPAILERLGR